MGSARVTRLSSPEERADYIFQLTKDVEALELMLLNNLIETAPIRIGAEQEFCLVDNNFRPNNNSLTVLKDIDDDHFTTEIGNYNLELNLDPLELKGDCFSQLKKQLKNLMHRAKEVAAKHDTKIILTGILPTLDYQHIDASNMTDIPRYFALDSALQEARGQDFNIHIKGVDEVNLYHNSVMLEGCNTSFQMHLQVDPNNFVDTYNWAQAISGPILSCCTNAPILFGKELWSESRIALFTQSIDTRTQSFVLNEKQSRVNFGNKWAEGTAADIFKETISRFRSLLNAPYGRNSVEMLNEGEIPKLKALNLHNGTVYPWNRVCYGISDTQKPHLRIENRYIPSGPTINDEIANMMFWVGVMLGKPNTYDDIATKMDFRDAKTNFYNAARYGMATQFYWNNKVLSSHQLILDELLPMAYRGLYSVGIDPKDAEFFLTIIKNRVESHTGSEWMIRSYRNLQKQNKPKRALYGLVKSMYEHQEKNYPVGSWNVCRNQQIDLPKQHKKVHHYMTTDLFTVNQNDSLELVYNVMKWNEIHHTPVINDKKELVGMVSFTDIMTDYAHQTEALNYLVSNVMSTNVISIGKNDDIEKAVKLMAENRISALPVVYQKKLIGILTTNDI